MRTSSKKLMRGAAALTVVALAVAACGSSGSDDASDGQAGTSDPGAVSSTDSGADSSAPAPSDEDPIVIGLEQDISGPSAPFATVAGTAIGYAIDEINANGGILGRQVSLIKENDESDPTKAPSVARKLIEQGATVVLLTSATSAIKQTKPIFTEEQVPAIGAISSSSTFADAPDNEFTYTVPTTNAQWVPVYCDAFKAEQDSSIAILADDSAVIKGMSDIMLPELEKCVTVTDVIAAPLNSQDVSAQVARISQGKPDAVLVMSIGGQFEVLAQNTLAQLAPDLSRFSLAGLGNESDAWGIADPGTLEGVVYMGSISSDNPNTMQLQDKFREWTGNADYVLSAFDAQSYDAVRMVKMAIENAGSTDGAKVNEALQALQNIDASFGQPGMTLSYGSAADAHIAGDSTCGLVLTVFGADNTPAGPWGVYQPECK